jgi:uncharacterized protein (TIGR03437 family)
MLHRAFLACLIAVIPSSLLAQSVTRYEQDDPRITYTGVWYPNTNPQESGGSAVLANLKGSQVIVIFNGTGITWIGTSDYYTGMCYLTLDGVQTTVDTSNPNGAAATLYQQPVYTISGLTPGQHRLTIEVTHSHDDDTNQSWIWVDAFDVQNGTLVGGAITAGAGLAQQTDVAANYSGHWFQQTGTQYSGGSVNMAVDTGARVDFTFNGTGVTWIGYRDQWSGIAQVMLDNVLQSTVDTYLNPSQAQTATYSLSGLSPGNHVLSIVATGTQSAASAGAWIWVDGFQVSNGAASPPTVTSAGLVNAASYSPAPNNQVAPGQLVSIFGQNFLAAGTAVAAAFPLPTQLGSQNTGVTACGQALPLYSVSAGQINAQLPVECPTTGTMTATITVDGQTATQVFSLAPAAPGVFTVNGSGSGDGIVVHADNSLVSSNSPANPGEEVVIYATGLGATNPQFADGTGVNQMNSTVMPVTVTIGGKNATVLYAGLTQGCVGLYQVNVMVPAGLTGSQSLVVTSGGTYSSVAGVTLSVQ